MWTVVPSLSFRTQISIIQIVIAVIDKIGFIAASLYHFGRLYREVSQIDVQPFAFYGFRYLFYFGLRFRFLRLRDSSLCHGRQRWASGAVYLHLAVSYDYTFADQCRYFESVFIFHQNLIFPFETTNDTSTGAVQEAHFVSYFYVTHHSIYFCYLLQK